MYRVITNIVINQVTQIDGLPARNKTISMDFVNEITCQDSWRDFTNEGTVKIPRNLYAKDQNGKLVSIFGNIGGFNSSPLLMRGDRIRMDYAYKYIKGNKEVIEGTFDRQIGSHLFEGWISEVTSKKPIEFKCEDNFWRLKQCPCPTKTFKATDTLEYIVSFLVDVYNRTVTNPIDKLTFKPITKTTFGEFRVGNETVAEVLGRLRKTYHFESYLDGTELRTGIMVYDESKAKDRTFTFQKDIISDELEYKRKEDVTLSILASNKVEEETGKTTKDGEIKTKCVRLEVLLTLANGSNTPVIFHKKKGENYPPNQGGERMTLQYPGAKSLDELIELASVELRKYYYTGFRGKFTTFGIPFTKMGDNIHIVDPVLPERNGVYKCKSVQYTAGVNGIRQEVQLDYRI